MKVLLINSVCGIRSTGRICSDLADILAEHGHECRIVYGRETIPEKYRDIAVRIDSPLDVRANALKARLLDNEGFNAVGPTKKLLAYMDTYAPDLIHIHNMHGYYLNMELLLRHIAKRGTPVVFTMHDCWTATGHCSHFTRAGCSKWQTGCYDCKRFRSYPASMLLDRSKRNWKRKKQLFGLLSNAVIVTPSQWLADVLQKSHLQDKRIMAIPNGVDLEVFQPTASDFRERYGLQEKYIVLGAATAWSDSKGLEQLCALQQELGSDYQVVLVGLSQQQCATLPGQVLGLPRTNSIEQLAGLYTAADVFINAGQEETMGLTTVEAMACGTPVVVSNLTAVPEVVRENGGVIFREYSVTAMAGKVRQVIAGDYPDTRSNALLYEKKQQYEKYIALYEEMVGR